MISRCNPGALVLASFLLAAGALAAPDLRGALIAAVALLIVVPALIGRARFQWLRLLPGVLAVVSVAWSNWLLAADRALEVAALAGLRIGLFVLPGIVFASFIEPFALGDFLGQRLRLPARPVVAATVALHRFESLGADWTDLERARRVRGLGASRSFPSRVRDLLSLAGSLLVLALNQAGRMAVAMEARGFSARRTRTWAEPSPWRARDTAVLVICTLLAALPQLSWFL